MRCGRCSACIKKCWWSNPMLEPLVYRWDLHTHADLDATWQLLSDTDRFNQIAGFDLQFELRPVAGQPAERRGRMQHLGLEVRWHELPVRFEAPHRFLIERVYASGPLSRAVHRMELQEDPRGGTQVRAENEFWPRQRWLRPLLQADLALTFRGKFGAGLQTMLSALDAQQKGSADEDPQRAAPPLTAAAGVLLRTALAQVQPEELRHRLDHWLRTAPLAEQARIQPLRLAKRWHLPEQQVTIGLLQATRAGLLQLQWELPCPSCRLPGAMSGQLQLEGAQAHCPDCDVRYDASLADSVVLTWRPVPAFRAQVGQIACLSSPARMPHIAAQRVLQPGEETSWELTLLPGNYYLRCLPLPDRIALAVRADASCRNLTVLVGPQALDPPALRGRSGRLTLHLRSKRAEPVALVVERAWTDPLALTAGKALEWPDVVPWLPADALQPGVAIEPFVGPLLAVRVQRGGAAGEQTVAAALKAAGARALQVSAGWVLATLPDLDSLVAAIQPLQGALWLTCAVGWGSVLELVSSQLRMAAGARLQDLVALAQQGEAGQVLVHREAAARLSSVTALEPMDGQEGWTWPPSLDRHKPPLTMPRRPARPPAPGDLMDDRYLLGPVVGEGGFGVVYAAQDQRSGEPVVVKLLRSDLAEDPIQVQRFFDEGRMTARLDSPHVVRVLEWGLREDGCLFLVMERLEGRELAELLHELGSLDPPRAIRLACQALRGLGQAHQLGLIHRDIKPSNLFVVGEGTDQEGIKVIDFGIALDLTGRVRSLERAGSLIGTPAYMAPEQVLGETLDGRSDLYALALVLYETLAGKSAFTGPTALALAILRLEQPARPLEQAASQPLPLGLALVVDGALAANPEERPADAQALAAALQAILATQGEACDWLASWQAHRQAAEPGSAWVGRTSEDTYGELATLPLGIQPPLGEGKL